MREICEAGRCGAFIAGVCKLGMFKNYEERGDKFKELVDQL